MTIPDIFISKPPYKFIACVGSNGYTDGATYASGFFEAARVILRHVGSNGGIGYDMDTLVYPLLYCIRHGLELGIKHLLRTVAKIDGIELKAKEIENHDLKKLWTTCSATVPFDRRFIIQSEGLEEIVSHFHLADATGQVFRYDKDTEGNRTLEDKSHVDFTSVEKILVIVQKKFNNLFRLVEIIVEERELGAFTSKFNREELEQLSLELPDYSTWEDHEDFEVIKNRWKIKLDIGNRAFSDAIDFIKKHQEFAGNIGLESNLRFLTDENLIDIVNLHIEYLIWCGPQKEGFTKASDYELPEGPMPDYEAVAQSLSANAIGEFLALADIGRQNDYSENFEIYKIQMTPSELEEVKVEAFRNFIFKLNLLPSLASGLQKAGARSLSQMVLDAKNKYETRIESQQN